MRGTGIGEGQVSWMLPQRAQRAAEDCPTVHTPLLLQSERASRNPPSVRSDPLDGWSSSKAVEGPDTC